MPLTLLDPTSALIVVDLQKGIASFVAADAFDELESCPDTSSCRSRQHLPYLGLCKPWGLQGPLG
ncbi:MAG: hypothetical protein ACYCYH_03755, partial [Steroidobacteraceae bacterium]